MFEKFNSNVFHKTIRGLKQGVLNGYHHVKQISNHIHHGVTTAAHIYNAVAPVLNHYVPQHGRHLHHTVSNLASNYNNSRSKVIEADHHINSVGSKLGGII